MLEVFPKLETEVTSKYKKYWTDDFNEIEALFKKDMPRVCAIDSETTGLHSKKDKPFMWVFAWLIPNPKDGIAGRAFAFDHTEEIFKNVFDLFSKCEFGLGHNLKFDLNMAINGGIEEEKIYSLNNVIDTMGVCRMSFDAVSPRDGGDLLGLKKVTEKYIDERASEFEKEVRRELKKINDLKRNVLKENMKPFKSIGWTLGKLKDAYKVKQRGDTTLFTKERKQRWLEVPKEVEDVYFKWIEEYPFANYSEVDKSVMTEYVHSDGIYTLEIFKKFYPEVLKRKQKDLLMKESKVLLTLLKMERVGMPVDMEYLKKSYIKCDQEIQSLYEEMWDIVGEPFTVSQSKVIAEYFETLTGELADSTDKAFLKKHKENRVSQIISRLRRLEKWMSTYITRILEVSEYDGNYYTGYAVFGTISGRLSSDAQQFPKEKILTEAGEAYEKEHGEGKAPKEEILFFPRQAFIVGKGKYNKMAYFDLSQIELRCQSLYTVLLGNPDLNLCRAYMPYLCHHYKTNEIYKYEKEEDRARWNERDEEGNSVWVDENGDRWTPTDVHSATAHNAIMSLGYECKELYKNYTHPENASIDEKSFKGYWRYLGKMFNFMRKIYSCACKTTLIQGNSH